VNVLLIGLGSIGKRHLANLLELGYSNIQIVSSKKELPHPYDKIEVHSTVQLALANETFEFAIICTPTAYHTEVFMQLLNAKVPNIYVEKPISHNWQYLDDIVSLAGKNNTHVTVGYDLHFDLGLQKVHSLLLDDVIGQLISVNAIVGQYLPDWRPSEDYRKGMSAKKETGGGVMLDLVHEFDYLYWLVGRVKTIASLNRNSGVLEIETEDIAEVLLQFENGVTGTIHLDYLQQKVIRNCLFTGSSGSIFWNLAESSVTWIDKKKEEFSFSYKHFERNDRFKAILKAFMEKAADYRLTNLQNGLNSLKMVLAAKHSCETKQFVTLKDFKP
jgi:predicted dehydrogenase